MKIVGCGLQICEEIELFLAKVTASCLEFGPSCSNDLVRTLKLCLKDKLFFSFIMLQDIWVCRALDLNKKDVREGSNRRADFHLSKAL